MGTNQERLDALAYGNRIECLLHISRYLFAADKISELQGIHKTKTILDAACGLGYGTEILKRNHPDKEVVGLDIDEKSVAYCRTLHTGMDIKYVCADIMDARAYDVIVSMETIEHIVDWQAVFSHLIAQSRILIFSVPWKQLATPTSKQYHRVFGLYDESFADLIPEDCVAEWYCQRRYDYAILPLEGTQETQRNFLLGIVYHKAQVGEQIGGRVDDEQDHGDNVYIQPPTPLAESG